MSATEWEDGQEDGERVNPDEVDAVPPGSADVESGGEMGGAGSEDVGSEGEVAGSGWTEGGGALGPEQGGAGAEDIMDETDLSKEDDRI